MTDLSHPTLAQAMARFALQLHSDPLPQEIAERARVCLLNGYGIGLGCLGTPYGPLASSVALAGDGEQPGGATLLADGRRTSVAGAALANSALFHGRAQEDTCGAAHLGAIMIPMLSALIEARSLPAQRLLPALVAGYELGGLLEHAYSPITTPAGLRSSPLYGTIAAAAASAVLLGLDEATTAAALANAASFTGGLLQSFEDGTDEWRYQVGVAGRNGLLATQLAQAGSVSAPYAFEGRSGFVRAYAKIDCDVAALAARLGQEWAIRRVTFKPFPVCAFNQTPVHAALALREKLAGRGIRSVHVRMHPFEAGYAGMDSKGPFASISATLMSIPFCIASTLLKGTPSMNDMTTYDDARVNALVDRVQLQADDSVARLCCAIELVLDDGERLQHEQNMTVTDYAYGREEVRALICRVGAEQDLPASLYQRLEDFVDDPARRGISEVVACFAQARQLRQQAGR